MLVKKILQPFLNTSSKNVFTLMSGTMIAQAIIILASPILTRLYTPEEYGILGVYSSFVSILAVIASLKFDAALLLPKKDDNAIQIFKLSLLLILGTSALITFLLFFFEDVFLELTSTPELKTYIYLGILSIILIGLFNVFNSLLNRFGKYTGMATAKIVKSSGTTFGQLGFGFSQLGFKGLIFGRLIGDFFAFLISLFILSKEKRFDFKKKEDSKSIYDISKEYKEFPKITALHALFNTISSAFPVFLLASFFSSDVVGNFNQSLKVTFLPITLISASTYQVFSRKVTETVNQERPIRAIATSTIKKLFLVGIVPFCFLLIFAPNLFGFIFGEEWKTAGEYTQLLTPYIFMVFIVSPLAYLPILRNRQRKAFRIEIFYMVFRVLGLFLGVYLGNVYFAIGLYGLIGFIFQIYYLYWFLNLAKDTP